MTDPADGQPATPPHALADRAAFLLRAALTRAETMGEGALTPLGITGREYGVLAGVRHGAATRPQREIGAALGLDRTTTMKVVTGLAARGLVVRVVDPRDRRAYRVELTAAGQQVVSEADRVLTECDDRFTAGRLDPDEAAALRDLLRRLV